MSAQTGEAAPSGPVSRRLVDRARYRVDVFKKEPNPIWIRELKQAARLARTPAILTALTILVTLLMASIGGIVSRDTSPATTGVVLFQVFFSLAYFVVTLVGPAVAANSIASEREGRTWEAVILTGLRPGVIARGKFLAAFTAIGMYIVMLAPVGALPFLFGGVTATEVVVAFLFLFLVALLSVAFGLAISSKMASLRAAILVTLLLAFPASISSYLSLGLGLSFYAHRAWPGVAEGPPIWLPTAYARAPFDLTYVVFLIVVPVVIVAIPAWFLYEVTIANLTSVTDDRSTGLKRWLLVAAPVLSVVAAVPVVTLGTGDRLPAYGVGMSALAVFLTLCVFLFQGDPAGPSRRVKMHWTRARAGSMHQFLGPGIVRSSMLLLFLGVGVFLLPTVAALIFADRPSIPSMGYSPDVTGQIISFAGYATAFFAFIVGFGAWIRSRTAGPVGARVMLFTVLFAVAVGPWVVAAIAGVVAAPGGSDEALAIAAPSPFYIIVMIRELKVQGGDTPFLVTAGAACAVAWAMLGLLFLFAARRRCDAVIQAHEAALAQTDRLLAEEDEAARAAAQAGPPPDATSAQAPAEIPPGDEPPPIPA